MLDRMLLRMFLNVDAGIGIGLEFEGWRGLLRKIV